MSKKKTEKEKALEITKSWQLTPNEIHEIDFFHKCPICERQEKNKRKKKR